ncbi:hypothetical protein [Streptomyces sp. NPDC057582]|uniref:hypothetical protein n=1 Tax=Streptomyces sp. NPDC057582 TaxID=3346174 RepID=UPI00369683DE
MTMVAALREHDVGFTSLHEKLDTTPPGGRPAAGATSSSSPSGSPPGFAGSGKLIRVHGVGVDDSPTVPGQ